LNYKISKNQSLNWFYSEFITAKLYAFR